MTSALNTLVTILETPWRLLKSLALHPNHETSLVYAPWSSVMLKLPRLIAPVLLVGLCACESIPLNGAKGLSAAEPEVSMITPMVEKREALTATGYAVVSMQNHKNPAQQRLLAIRASKLDAYRALTEQVYGQYLDATTTVADMMVQSDSFRTKVEGVIYGATLVSITPAGDDTYETTLSLDKAVVQDLRALYLGQVQAKGR